MSLVTQIDIGVDPGKSGGVACAIKTKSGNVEFMAYKMPDTERDISELFRKIRDYGGEDTKTFAYLEKVHAFPTAIPDKSIEHKKLIKDVERLSSLHDTSAQRTLNTALNKLKKHVIVKRGATATWTFAQGYGFLRGCLISLGIPFDEFTAKSWQKIIGVSGGGDRAALKKKLKGKAQQLYPDIRVTEANQDALLILYAGMRIIKRGQGQLPF